MPSIVAEDNLFLRRAVSATMPACSRRQVCKNLSTSVRNSSLPYFTTSDLSTQSRSNVPKAPSAVSTARSTSAVDKSSAKSNVRERRCSQSRRTCLSMSPSGSQVPYVRPLVVLPSHNPCSIIGKSCPEVSSSPWQKIGFLFMFFLPFIATDDAKLGELIKAIRTRKGLKARDPK